MTFQVLGIPAPQGSKRHVGRGIMVESSKKVAPWRQAVAWAAHEARGRQQVYFSGPVAIEITFFLPRPKSAPKSVVVPAKKPDLDKLIRSTFDALTESGLIEDDARIVSITASKRFVVSPDESRIGYGPGARITVLDASFAEVSR